MTRAIDRGVLALAIVALSWSCIVVAQWKSIGIGWFADWQTYALAWLRVSHGGPLYDAAQVAGPYRLPDMIGRGYAYPPASVVLFAPFSSWPAGFIAWTTVNVGTLLTALWALATRISPMRRTLLFAAMLLGLAGFFPFEDGVGVGNLSIAAAGLFGWAYVLGERTAPGLGAIAGLARLTSGTLALAGLRNRRAAFKGIALGALLVVASLPIVGLDAWLSYPAVIANAMPDCYPGNIGIGCVFPGVAAAKWLTLLLALAVAAGAVAIPRYAYRIAFAGVASLLLSMAGDFHRHYWVLLALIPVILLADATARRRSARELGHAPTTDGRLSALPEPMPREGVAHPASAAPD